VRCGFHEAELKVQVRVPTAIFFSMTHCTEYFTDFECISNLPPFEGVSAEVTMECKDDLFVPRVAGDEGGAIIEGERVVPQLKDGSAVESEDRLSPRRGDIHADVNITRVPFELLSDVHLRAMLGVPSDTIGSLKFSMRVIAF